MMTLVGMFFTWDQGDTFCTGQVVSEPTPGKYLVSIDARDDSLASPMEMVCSCEMTESDGKMKNWAFFLTRTDLEAWMKWLSEPDDDAKPKVVKMAKKDQH